MVTINNKSMDDILLAKEIDVDQYNILKNRYLKDLISDKNHRKSQNLKEINMYYKNNSLDYMYKEVDFSKNNEMEKMVYLLYFINKIIIDFFNANNRVTTFIENIIQTNDINKRFKKDTVPIEKYNVITHNPSIFRLFK